MARLSPSRESSNSAQKFLFKYFWEEKRLFVLTVGLTGLSAVFEGVGLGLLVPFLENLMSTSGESFRSGVQWVDTYLLGVDAPKVERLYRTSALILGAVFMRSGLNYAAMHVGARLQESILDKIRREIIDQIQSVSLQFFSRTKAGDILNTLTGEISRLSYLFGTATAVLIFSFMAAVYVAAIVVLSWQLALIALALCALLFITMSGLVKRLKRQGMDVPKKYGELTSRATEIINGIRTILAFGSRRFEADRYKRISREVADLQVSLRRKSAIVGPLSQAVASVALIAIVIIAVQFFVMRGMMSAAALLAFLFALFRLLPVVQNLNDLRGTWARQRGALEAVSGMLRTDDKPYLPDGWRDLPSFKDKIKLRNVGFSYEQGSPVLTDINLTVTRGRTVAFVGSSGAGKSTLADLIARFHDPNEGVIYLDGIDLKEYKMSALRQRIAIVDQNTFLFNESVRDNIAYGLKDVTDEQVRNAAEQANALEFIDEMEEGFDTILGDRGIRLSGGQRQRIAIARAFLRDSDILILDEATSALDSVSEQLIQESMEILMRGRTVIIIAHRLSTVETADEVVVLENGKIVEQGEYGRLLESRGKLWEYHSIQYQAA